MGTLTIRFGAGYVGDEFTAKSGRRCQRIKIPNADAADESLWSSFVVLPEMVRIDEGRGAAEVDLPEDGSTRVSTPLSFTGEDGSTLIENVIEEVPNRELKRAVEAYKERRR